MNWPSPLNSQTIRHSPRRHRAAVDRVEHPEEQWPVLVANRRPCNRHRIPWTRWRARIRTANPRRPRTEHAMMELCWPVIHRSHCKLILWWGMSRGRRARERFMCVSVLIGRIHFRFNPFYYYLFCSILPCPFLVQKLFSLSLVLSLFGFVSHALVLSRTDLDWVCCRRTRRQRHRRNCRPDHRIDHCRRHRTMTRRAIERWLWKR